MQTNREIIEFLSHKENWSQSHRYIHKSRLLIGYSLGILTGGLLVILVWVVDEVLK